MKKRKFRCIDCGKLGYWTLAPDPFFEEMLGEKDKYRQCDECRYLSFMEV